MQSTVEQEQEQKQKNMIMNNIAVSIPNSIYATKIIGKDPDIESHIYTNTSGTSAIMDIWNKQHPLIHTWLLLSSISICFLSALLFIVF